MKNLDTEVIIIGSGVIGLSIAYFLSKNEKKVILVEKEKNFGEGVSSRNTEVIHAGIYYAKESLKSRLCLSGKEKLYEFCKRYHISHKKIGKLFIAINKNEEVYLEKINSQALANGLMDLKYLSKKQIQIIEPALKCEMAILSPSSGIVDSHGLMDCLLRLSQDNGTIFSAQTPFLKAEYSSNCWKVYLGGKDPTELSCKVVINAAGLHAIDISNQVVSNQNIPIADPVKGLYLRYLGKSPLKHIVYPALIPGKIKERADATPDLNESLRFGPSVEKSQNNRIDDFSINPNIRERFFPLIRKYLPNIDINKLHLDIAGIRPKVKKKSDTVPDFMFEWGTQPGWLDLWNIESPGLTACLAIGEHVLQKVKNNNLL